MAVHVRQQQRYQSRQLHPHHHPHHHGGGASFSTAGNVALVVASNQVCLEWNGRDHGHSHFDDF